MGDPIVVITDLLRDEHGIPAAKLHPSARLGHDLGVDGDDASDLFQRLHCLFGTDFSALDGQWTEFFDNEGASPRSILIGFALLISSTAVTVWIASVFRLSTNMAGALGVVMFAALWVGLGWIFPRKAKRPVTIAGLADVVRTGAWPTDPEKVR